ncbi:transcription factor bHLH148-like [Argentina anserina]|uniref:transcription factor bHLH148-like n=1 Tax=Argentina anserina TaxID=57926 RepID=UPI0021768464|nr:transcription factor bHLH148-like [Potentilla anserina]
MASTLISNPVATSDRPRDSSRIQQRNKKKKKLQPKHEQPHHLQPLPSHAKWKSPAQQHLYSSKLLQALHHVDPTTSSSSTCPPPPPRGRAVREAADRVLAAAAKGRTRWSRAILTNRLKIKFRQHRKQSAAAASAAGVGRLKKQKFSVLRLKGKGLPAVQRKVRVLGRLVPGCRKQPLPVILEEATDYIAALEMQVRAMSRLTQLLSVSGAGGSSSSPPPS